jgi:hypothetical protein
MDCKQMSKLDALWRFAKNVWAQAKRTPPNKTTEQGQESRKGMQRRRFYQWALIFA